MRLYSRQAWAPLALLGALTLGPVAASAVGQTPAASVPAPDAFLGYPLGGDFTDYRGVRDYVLMLAEQSPLASYFPYGESVEGRELIQLAIARPDHLARLEEILALNAELTHAATTAARAEDIAAVNPGVVYFSYGVHGNESSSSEAALWTAYDLVTGAAEVAGVLDSLVVIIDPVTNPDGRDRYVHWYRSVASSPPNPNPESREHREPWPGGRSNHYLFDLNRDWAWMTQPETRARLATWWRWNPQVHVDFHEMSPNSSYFFFPASPPINPIYPEHILEWGRRFGEGNARAFDARGWHYFTGESYDMLYPGYGDSWPSLHGAIGMTYEQAGGGGAGLAYRRSDGDTLTLVRRISQHRTTGNTTLRTAAAGKTRLLLDFAAAHRTAGEGDADFLLVPGSDPSRLDALTDHLLAQGIEVESASETFRAAAEPYQGFVTRSAFPEGTRLVRARQPRGRLAITLLQEETELQAEFSYDISAWSLPYAYGVEAHRTTAPPDGVWSRATASTPPAALAASASYGYLVAPGDQATAGIGRYLAIGGRVRVLTRTSTLGGRQWPAGSWYLPGAGEQTLGLLESSGLAGYAAPVQSGLSEDGIDLGSARAPAVQLPRIGLIGGDGVNSTSYGAHWYHLERHLGLPFDALQLADLTRLDLRDYDILILPDAGSIADDPREALRQWVENGGRLVAVAGGAATGAAIAGVELREPEDPEDTATSRFLLTREERERQEWNEEAPGAILQGTVDPGHPLVWGSSFDGYPDRLFILNEGARVFEPSDQTETVIWFPEELDALSGVISEPNLDRMAQGAWLLTREMGDGQVILFADDPLFRLFWRSTMPLYANAILLGGL